MSIELVPFRRDHLPELARICSAAFSALHDHHNVPRDIPSPEVGQMILAMIAARPDYTGIVAIQDGKLIGSNFLLTADRVAGVGPITVDPAVQSRGVGRMLMQWAIDESRRRNVVEMRLFQEAVNTTSLSLYTKLGFDWADAAVVFDLAPAPIADDSARPATSDDLAAIDRLSTEHHGSSRVNDAKQLLQANLPSFVRVRGGRTVGYLFGTLFGHAAGETPDDLLTLVGQAARHLPKELAVAICPTSQAELFRSMLTAGHRVRKVVNYMSLGRPYQPPRGNWMPSIQC